MNYRKEKKQKIILRNKLLWKKFNKLNHKNHLPKQSRTSL